MRHQWGARTVASVAVGAVCFVHCYGDPGYNENERAAGNGDNGVPVWSGELAIDPTGRYVLTTKDDHVVYADLESGETKRVAPLENTTRVAFDHTGETVFATLLSASVRAEATRENDRWIADADAEGETLVRYDLTTGKKLWSKPIEIQAVRGSEDREEGTYPFLEVTDDDASLIVTMPRSVDVYDADSGRVIHTTGELARSVVDVDLTPDQSRIVITMAHSWRSDSASTKIQIRDLEAFKVREAEVPNCSDELAITPNGKYALLAPTRCTRDPVSVIDLETGKFLRNLPGFGPVALAQDGALAVAFMDTQQLDASLFDDKSQIPTDGQRYRLMLIDTETLKFETVELGDDIPRYAVSPNGQLLLVDAPSLWRDGRVRILDTHTRELKPLYGPSLDLGNYVITRDSSTVFLLDRGLFRIQLGELRVIAEPLTFTPTHLNITPDDTRLVLREGTDRLWLYDIATSELQNSLSLEP